MTWRKSHIQRDVGLERLFTLMSSVEAETAGHEFEVGYGYAPSVEGQAVSDMKDGLKATETTGPIDYVFTEGLLEWVGDPIERPDVTVREAELNIADPEFPEDLKHKLADALEDWYRLEAEYAEIFRTLYVLSGGDRTFDYF